jgi:hypothetical protein
MKMKRERWFAVSPLWELKMKRNKWFIAIALMGVSLVTRPRATAAPDDFESRTILTFDAPVEVPGKVLPAGTYVFRIVESTVNRDIVQILAADEKHVLVTTLTLPDFHKRSADKTVLVFEERPSGDPLAISEWFHAGDNFGHVFAYPHERAMELAKRTGQNVLSMEDRAGVNMKSDVTAISPTGQSVPVKVVILGKPGEGK